jgi:2',3'-cyclic-nucleotide 2'-phosphodiesterase (5'-nucleotidase family)
VDAGNFAAGMGSDAWIKGNFVWDLMAALGYDVATPGDHDLYQGVDSLKALAARHPEIALVSANLLDPTGKHVLPESKVIDRDGVRFGVTGVTDSVYAFQNRAQHRLIIDDFRYEGMKEALARVVPELRKKSDVVVVLFHTQVAEIPHLIADVPGIDVGIAGHTPGYIQNPEKIGDAWVLRPGNRGQDLGVAKVYIDPDSSKVSRVDGEGEILDEKVPMDQAIAARIDAWQKARVQAQAQHP